MKTKVFDRRTVLKGSAAAMGTVVTAPAVGKILGANERIRLGFIGCGGRGRTMMIEVAELKKQLGLNVEIVAVCDVYKRAREGGVADVKKLMDGDPDVYIRYPDVLQREDVDAVVVATPDFWHVPSLVDAIKAGKDVYIEKPLAWNLDEAKQAREVVHASDRVVQVGTQGRSTPSRFAARDFIRSGKLGQVSTIRAAMNDCGPRWRREDACAEIKAADFDWDFYLHDRPKRPFDPRRAIEWRLFWEFSCGPSGLLGSHMYDAVQFLMDDPLPATAVSHGGIYLWDDGRETPDTFMTLIEYPKDFLLHYTTRLGNSSGFGIEVCGTRGVLDPHNGQYSGLGGNASDKLPDETATLDFDPPGPYPHMHNFLGCLRTRKTPIGSIDAGYQHTVTVLMTNEALRTGRKQRYDTTKEAIVPA